MKMGVKLRRLGKTGVLKETSGSRSNQVSSALGEKGGWANQEKPTRHLVQVTPPGKASWGV